MKLLRDWSGDMIPSRVRPVRADEGAEPGQYLACELDPHRAGQWQTWGRGRSSWDAERAALEAWNDFDRQQ